MASQRKTNNTGVMEQTATNGADGAEDVLAKEPTSPSMAAAEDADGGDELGRQPAAQPGEYQASIHQVDAISTELGETLRDLSIALGSIPVWLLNSGRSGGFSVPAHH